MDLRYVEFSLLFVVLPLSLTLNIPIQVKVSIAAVGVIYAFWRVYKEGIFKKSVLFHLNGTEYWKAIFARFVPAAIILFFLVYFFKNELLFKVLLNKPGLFIIIVFVYTFLSVFPQELIYRAFYFKRYGHFFKSEWMTILMNALIFSLAHIMFLNALVLILTFIGGILFAITYRKTNSYLMTSIEHTLYGLWLFTLGTGDMLAFPS